MTLKSDRVDSWMQKLNPPPHGMFALLAITVRSLRQDPPERSLRQTQRALSSAHAVFAGFKL